jgi:AAA+ ATPase superfamily predicted ATPase
LSIPYRFIGRETEEARLTRFLALPGAGFTHLRGRRRVGKTELLRRVSSAVPDTFFFMGRHDEANRAALRRWAGEWDEFVGRRSLTRLRASELSWDTAMGEVAAHAARLPEGRCVALLLDEIQWLAGPRTGFCGLLKEHWGEWRKLGRVKVVLCGSSNRFFQDRTDGEMAVLRGLRTQASIEVVPFSLREIAESWFPRWTREEVCLVTMMVGGVPYYLENIDPDSNFIRAINSAMFTRDGIFLEEVDALLKLETSTVGSRRTVKRILGSLGQDGATQSSIVRRTGLPQARVHKTLDRLADYGLVHERMPLGSTNRNRRGVRFYMDDFYLNFYFSVLEPIRARIQANADDMLFPVEVLSSKTGFYIPGFTGRGLELLIGHVLETGRRDEGARRPPIFDKLGLRRGRFRWGTYWQPGETQIDIVIEGIDDREVRLLEAKWIGRRVSAGNDYKDQVLAKRYPGPWRKSRHLMLSAGATPGFTAEARRRGVGILGLADLF